MDVTFTPAALHFIRRMLRLSGRTNEAGFRLTVMPGGCSGYDAQFSIENQPASGDEILQVDGMRLFLPAVSRMSLTGVTVDFSDGILDSGLTFHNPNATSCGCSTGSAGGNPTVTKVSIARIGRKTERKDPP